VISTCFNASHLNPDLLCKIIAHTKFLKWEDKSKVGPRTDHESPEGEQKYISTVSSTSALDCGAWSKPSCSCFISSKDKRYPMYKAA
jgi:hypothetical protein